MRWLLSSLVLVAMLGDLGASAHAQRLPLRYVNRPLTLPREIVRPDIALIYTGRDRTRDDSVDLNFGFGAGIARNLEIGAWFAPLRVWHNFDYQNPELYGIYRLLTAPAVEIGLEVRTTLPVESRIRSQVGFPFLIRAAGIVRIDTGAYLVTDFQDADLWIPLELAIQASKRVFIGFDTGFTIPHGRIPLGFFVGHTSGQRRRPTVDLRGGFRLVDATDGFSDWQLYLTASFYIFL